MNVSAKDKRAAYVAVAQAIHAIQNAQSNPAVVRCAIAGVLNGGKLNSAKSLLEDVAVTLGNAEVQAETNERRRK